MSIVPPVRVRFAPSPTGKLHIGSVRTALLNWLFARHYGGKFILRIEDTDLTRSTQEALDSILVDLKWLGLDWDEGPQCEGAHAPYFQRERAHLYTEYANKLLDNGNAYWCYCTLEELSKMKEESAAQKRPPMYDGRCRYLSKEKILSYDKEGRGKTVRFKVPEGVTVVNDLIRGEVRFDNKQVDDFVILKSDGQALYNFACVVDDALMKITHVLRGEEHLSNTPKQIIMYNGLAFKPPSFGHLSIILDEQRKKLSKREGATFLSDFRERGYFPEALINFLALLGWAPSKDDKELFTISELIKEFSIEGVSKSPAIFNEKKLEWMNSQYIKSFSKEKLLDELFLFLKKRGFVDGRVFEEKQRGWLLEVVELCKERIHTLSEFLSMAAPIFGAPVTINDPDALTILSSPYIFQSFTEIVLVVEQPDFNMSNFEEVVRRIAANLNLKAGDVIQPLRVAFTGKRVSPGLFEMAKLMGKELVVRRIKNTLSLIEQSELCDKAEGTKNL